VEKNIGAIAANFSFIDQTSQAARSGNTPSKGTRKGNGRVAVVNQIDFVAGYRELVTRRKLWPLSAAMYAGLNDANRLRWRSAFRS